MRSVLSSSSPVTVTAFETPLGWLGLAGRNNRLIRILIGHPGPESILQTVVTEQDGADVVGGSAVDVADWFPNLRRRLQRFADGHPEDFGDIALHWPRPLPPFRAAVIRAARQIEWGTTVTYSELAARAGSPKAARAVGSAMAGNLFPIVVPCHRVLGRDGRLCGFSAPRGLELKQQMLALESSKRPARRDRAQAESRGDARAESDGTDRLMSLPEKRRAAVSAR